MTHQMLKANNAQLDSLLKNNDINNPKIKEIIRKMKLLIYSIQNIHLQPTEVLVQARTFSELNLFYTLATRNDKNFDLAIENARFFYENHLILPPSEGHYQVKSIHLLSLLSAHKNQEFYSKLEDLYAEQMRNPLIQYVFKINDAIEEGNYRRVFKLKKESPLTHFSPFLDKISDTVRIQIAKSAQKAYNVLSIKDALQVFQLESENEFKKFVQNYITSQQDNQIEWSIQDGHIYFKKVNKNKVNFNSEDLIQTSLVYANEWEKIA